MNQRKTCNPIQKTIAILLSVCLVVSAIPAATFADDSDQQKERAGASANTGSEAITYLNPEDVTEDEAILSESGEDYTTFDLGGKKRYSIFFTENVRFKDENGELTDYDPAYIELDSAFLAQSEEKQDRSGYLYRNTAGDSYQYIPEALSEETPVLLEKDDYQITIAPTEKTYKDFFGKKVKVKKEKEKTEDAYGNVKKKNVKATYKDETALAYVEYISLNTGIKENIVLTKRPAKNELQFEISAPGLVAEVSEADGSIGFYDKKSKELVNQILPPNMNDATGEAYSEDLAYTIEEKEDETDTYILTLTIDKKYLKAKEREYPVTIDPTNTWANTSSGESLWDAYVYSGSASTNYYTTARQSMPVGKGSGGTYRTYINFLSLKSVINGTLVDSAELSVYENADSYSGRTIEAYKVTSSWDKKTITWNKQPTVGATRTSSMTTSGVDKRAGRFNLTLFARNISTGSSNYGIMLRNAQESSTAYAEFYGSRYTSTTYRPKLSVTYFGDGDGVMDTWNLLNDSYEAGEKINIIYQTPLSGAITSIQYRLVNTETGQAVNPAGAFETIETSQSGRKFTMDIPIPDDIESGTYRLEFRMDYYNGSSTIHTRGPVQINGIQDEEAPTVESAYIVESVSPSISGWRTNPQPMVQLTGIKDDITTEFKEENITYVLDWPGTNPVPERYKTPESLYLSKSGGAYMATFYIEESLVIQGRYAIYVKVTDEAGNACISEIPYWFDNEPPTGRISAKNQGEITETNELSGISYITGTPDLDTGSPVVSNIMSLHQKGENGAAGEKVCDIYDNASGSTSGANSKAFDTRKIANGTYVLKMNLTDAAGNRKTITKEITIANRIAKPQLTAATSKGGETIVQFNMPSSVKAITGLQYKVEEKDADWTDITGITTLSGTFTAVLPDKEGTYILSVRAIDQDGLPGEERTINIRVDKTLPTAEIAEADQGIIRGSAADEEFSGWKIYIKEKSAADESYREVLSGDTEKEDALFGDIGLYNENYAAGWYTIKLEVMDIAGNVKTVTCDIYKDENCPAPTIVDPAFRIERPDDQSYDSPQIIFGTDAAYMQLTAGFFRSFTLSSADWYIENQKAEENSQTSSLKTEDGKGKYEEGRPYCVAAVTHGLFGGAAYSSTLIENARAEKISFDEKGEGLVTMENMVSFTLRESEEDCTYYAKTTGDFVEIKAGETVEILSLSDGSLTSESLTIKAVKENGMPSEVMLTLDRLETETFVIDGMENYRPKGLSAKDKINYKTYLKWKIPERLPEDISYEIYRSTEKGFDPLLQEPLAEVNAGCFVEPNADYETRFYYRVRAVKRDNKGAVISYSAFSDEAESTVVDENEFIKRLGYKEYWNYADFQLPSGSGAIEKSQGNFFYEQTDLTLPNEQLPVELTRTYNSMASSKSAFGIGWNHNYDIELLSTDYSDKLETGQRLVMKDSSGTLFFFTKEPNASGEYISSMGKYLTLRKLSGEEGKITIKLPDKSTGSQDGKVEKTIEAAYLVETKENLSYYFSASGQLVYMEEPNGNFLLFTYDLYTGLVKSVMTSNNLEMTFVYNDKAGTDPATVKKVIMPDGSGMSYTYADGRLAKATRLGTGGETGASFTYGYDGNGNLKIMTDAAGNVYQIEADRDGSVKEAVYPDGESLLFTRSKGAEGMEQTVTAVKKDGFTLSEETAAFDVASGNCLEVVDGNGLVTAYSYRDEMLAKTTEQVTYEVIGEETGLVTEQIDTYVTTTEYDDTLNVTEEATEISQWEELVEYEYDNTGEFDEDFPSREITRRGSTVTGDFTYLYDIFGNLTSQFDNITGVRTDYDYYTEEDGDIDDFLYGEIESETESINGVVTSTVTYSYTYDSAGNKTETTTETVGDTVTVTVTKYDLMGRELESTVTVCGVLKSMGFYTYDSFGRVTRATEQEGSRITTVVTSYTANDAVSSQTTTTTENGKSQTESVSYTYDNMNRVANTVTTTGGKQRSESTSIHYGSIDKNAALGDTEKVYAKITTTVSGSQVSKTFTDGSGNVLRQDSQGISTYYTYDKSGNCLSQVTLGEGQTMADTAITAYLYDARGNQIRTIRDADYDREAKGCRPGEFSIQSKTFYNDQNQAVRVDHSSFFNSDTMAYDIEGRLTEFVQDANVSAVKTSVSYADPTQGNEASSVTITMANGTKSRTVTNLSGQVISESTIGNAADGEITKTYGYAEDGTLSKETDAAGNYRTYEYDSLDREIAINYFDAAGAQTLRTEFSYDTGGNVSEMKDYAFESGSKTLYRWTETRYDESGNLISEAEVSCEGAQPSEGQLEARRITYAYDNDDRLVRVSYPSGFDSQVEALEYAYDDYGRLSEITAVTSTGRAVLREYTYNVRGQIETIKDNREALGGTGYALKTYGYDKLDRNTSITVTDSERDGEAEKYIYTYNYDDQIVEEVRKNVYSTETDKQINERRYYEYDNLGRMVLGNGIRYTYDTVGNCLTETEKGITTTSTYNSLNQLITKGSAVYSYDANGNQIKEVDGNAVKDFSYDADNRLDTVTYTENGAEVFRQENLYNGQGQRIAKYEQVQGKDSEETHYAYGCGSVVFTDGSVGKKSLNLLGDAGNIIAAERDAETGKDYYFYNKDIRASTTSILDSSGNCANSYECSDFGETTVHGDLYNEICYTGGIYDASTGLYYLNARYYDPADKRFLTEDTYRGSENDPNTLHLYAYCANNPVNYVDPSGHFGIFFIPWIAKGAAIVIGGITLTYLTTTKEFQEAWGRAIRGIENTLSGASEYVKSKAKSLSKAIGKSFSKAKRKYKDKYEEHHIVARTKTRAKPARDILNKVGIKIENPINKIKIKKGLHKRLHRNDYFDIVNSMIQSAYDKKGNKKRKVENALKNLRAFITALDKAAPF